MCTQNAKRHVDQVISDLATSQHGVVGRAQLRMAGMSDRQISYRIRTGRLHPLHRGIYAVGPPTRAGQLMAAVLASGAGAVISHQTAADHLELRPSASRSIHITIPTTGGRSSDVLTLHRSILLPESEVTVHETIPVTTPARTLLDLAAVLRFDQLERAVTRAEARRLFDLRAVEAVLDAHPGRAGRRALAAAVSSHAPEGIPRNDLEERFLDLCARAGIRKPEVNVQIGPFECDFLWRRERVIAETDGHGAHGTRAAFEHDRARDARLAVAGYRVVRFSYRQVTFEPAFVADVLRELLARSIARQGGRRDAG